MNNELRTMNYGKNNELKKVLPRCSKFIVHNSILGFTLIELLVAISIIGILSGIGLASYINFNRSQLVLQSGRKVVQDLRLAQSMADNNQKPATCGTLSGYTFSFNLANNSYKIEANCDNPPYDRNPVKIDSIPPGLMVTGFSSVKFKVLRQGIICDPCNLNIVGFNKTKKVVVDPGGAIKLEEL